MFSLIIPYHNREKFLPRTLQSVVALTVKPDQIVLVNNASTDASESICQAFAAAHPAWPIMLVREPRKGASFARNRGLLLAREPWVYFFDSDDELTPTFFADVQHYLQQTTAPLDLVAAATLMQWPDGRTRPRVTDCTNRVTSQVLLQQLSTQSMVIRTEFLRRQGGWNEQVNLWDDWELGVRLLHRGARVAWLRGTYHRIHQHAESLTAAGHFASRMPVVVGTLSAVARELAGDAAGLQALAYRISIVAGLVRREGAPDAAQQLGLLAQQQLRAASRLTCWTRLVSRFLQLYTAWGGRGAWRIARLFC